MTQMSEALWYGKVPNVCLKQPTGAAYVCRKAKKCARPRRPFGPKMKNEPLKVGALSAKQLIKMFTLLRQRPLTGAKTRQNELTPIYTLSETPR